ncbi:MAG: hypothetical protein JO247_09440, partial [Chloroflexi bacterium]|nr:hypothetical protein [Chloroflexota bacterium]
MADQALQAFTQLVFVAVFVLTGAQWLRRRDRAHFEIAALFATLGALIVLQGFTQLTGIRIPHSSTVGAVVLLAQPYLLLRLLEHFRPLPRLVHAVALVLLLGSEALVIRSATGAALIKGSALGVLLAFALLELAASAGYVQAARRFRGVSRRRLIAVAAGCAALAGVILVAIPTAVAPSAKEALTLVSRVLSLTSAL